MGAGKKKMGGGIMFIHVNKVYRVLIHKTQPCIQLFLFLYLLGFFQFKGGGGGAAPITCICQCCDSFLNGGVFFYYKAILLYPEIV